MKKQTMINLIAGAGLALGPYSVMASGFGGGWMQDKVTGTLYYSLAETPERHKAASDVHKSERLNSFGGGWVQDKVTGTLFYSHAQTREHYRVASN